MAPLLQNTYSQNDWVDVAESRVEATHNPKLYIGLGLVGGLVVGSLLNPVAGVSTLLYGLYQAWQGNEKNTDYLEAVNDGLIAPVLGRQELQHYIRLQGRPRVQQELHLALRRGLPLSEAATAAAKAYGLDFSENVIDVAAELLEATQLELDRPEPGRPSEGQGIGVSTRLHAIDVASPIETPPISEHPVSNHLAPNHAAELRLIEDLATPVQNTLIIGKPGSGKSMILANSLRHLKTIQPNRTLYLIDPKADPLEQPYWQGVCDCVAAKACAELLPLDVWDWVQSCIQEYRLLPSPKLLVLDELRYLSNTFARINDSKTKALDTFWYIIESFTSLGDVTGSHVWGASQSAHTSDLKISGGSLGQFRVIALVNCVDFGFYDTLSATNIVQRHPDACHLQQVVAAQSPVGRVYYDSRSRKWHPLPALSNHSQRDRDLGIMELPLQKTNLNLDGERRSASVMSHAASMTDQPASFGGTPTSMTTVTSQLGPTPEPTIEDKILAYLDRQDALHPAHTIRSNMRCLKEYPVEIAKVLLDGLTASGKIYRARQGSAVKYGSLQLAKQHATGTSAEGFTTMSTQPHDINHDGHDTGMPLPGWPPQIS